MNIIIKENLKTEICSLIKTSKKEVVLLLDGEKKQNVVEVHAVVPVKNSARSDFAFIVEEEDFLHAKDKIRHDFVGLFHSHKSSNVLSESDISQMKKTDYPWMIGSFSNEELILSVYYIENSKIKELKLY